MSKYYVEIHSEAIEEFNNIEADDDTEAEEMAMSMTELEDPVVYTVMKFED